MRPGIFAVLALVSLSRVAAADSASAAPAQAPPAAQASAPAPASFAPPAAPAATGGVRVTLKVNRPEAVLERRVGSVALLDEDGSPIGASASLWERICTAPCGLVVPPAELYRIGGEGVHPSDPFRLGGRGDEEALDAHVGAQSGISAGKSLVAAGVGLAVIGVIVTAVFPKPSDPGSERTYDAIKNVGWGMVGIGAGLTVIGVPLWAANGTTVTSGAGRVIGRATGAGGSAAF